EQFATDRPGLAEFVAEADHLAREVVAAGPMTVERKRLLHTLKGNCAQFGLASVAAVCHALEERISDGAGELGDADRDELQRVWTEARARASTLLGDGESAITISESEHEQFLCAVAQGEPHPRLARRARAWRLEPTERRLQRLATHARALAGRLGKGDVRVVIEPNAVRLDARVWAPFWSAFVHVLRNALDHGLERPEERLAAGKPAVGRLTLRTLVRRDTLVIEAEDDGRGVDWDALAARCRRAGLPCETRGELEAALLGGGITTRSEATEFSGRGMGMGAVAAVCSRLGGSIRLQSESGRGTLLRFSFPASMGERESDMPPPSRRVPGTATVV
ncbi:MAG: Hpt domain-containing protein, partial [Myxococcales bacterium]|nr:Hpt domain-containing protein [Myxococcales bacterium]